MSPKKIPREQWEQARKVCGQAASRDACTATEPRARSLDPNLSCRWTNSEKVVTTSDVTVEDRITYGCRPWNDFGSQIDPRFKGDPARLAWLPISIAIIVLIIASLLIIVTPIIAKGAIDLYPIIAIAWFVAGLIVIVRVQSYAGYIVGLVVFLFIDGIVDSFMTGGFAWIGPPFILDANWDIFSPYLIYLYLFCLWTSGFLARSYIAVTRFSLDWFKVAGITIGSWIISASGVSDYINLSIRPKVPDFDTYYAPLGFWTWERFTIRTIIHVAIGIAIIYWSWRTPHKSVLALVSIIGVATILSAYPFVMDIFI